MNIQESCSIVESSNHLIITHELISFIYSTQLNSTQLNSTDTHPWTTDRVRRPWGKNWTNLPQPENIRLSSGQRAGHPLQLLEVCWRYCWSLLLITEPVLYWYSIGFVCWFDLICYDMDSSIVHHRSSSLLGSCMLLEHDVHHSFHYFSLCHHHSTVSFLFVLSQPNVGQVKKSIYRTLSYS